MAAKGLFETNKQSLSVTTIKLHESTVVLPINSSIFPLFQNTLFRSSNTAAVVVYTFVLLIVLFYFFVFGGAYHSGNRL